MIRRGNGAGEIGVPVQFSEARRLSSDQLCPIETCFGVPVNGG